MYLGSLLKVRHKPKEGQTYQFPPPPIFFGGGVAASPPPSSQLISLCLRSQNQTSQGSSCFELIVQGNFAGIDQTTLKAVVTPHFQIFEGMRSSACYIQPAPFVKNAIL